MSTNENKGIALAQGWLDKQRSAEGSLEAKLQAMIDLAKELQDKAIEMGKSILSKVKGKMDARQEKGVQAAKALIDKATGMAKAFLDKAKGSMADLKGMMSKAMDMAEALASKQDKLKGKAAGLAKGLLGKGKAVLDGLKAKVIEAGTEMKAVRDKAEEAGKAMADALQGQSADTVEKAKGYIEAMKAKAAAFAEKANRLATDLGDAGDKADAIARSALGKD